MNLRKTPLNGLLIIEPGIIHDERGYFFESYRKSFLTDHGIDLNFLQENESKSNRGILRGLHLQAPPHGQDKLLRVVTGSIYDVVVDIRKDSPTYGHNYGLELNASNKILLLVPQGFAHGFCSLEDNTIFQYRCSAYYHSDSEMGILWDDPSLNIKWPISDPIISEKDKSHPFFRDFKSPF